VVDDADRYAMAVIAHRAPEVADIVIPISALVQVIEIVDAPRQRLEA
jgi:hypothetical protein